LIILIEKNEEVCFIILYFHHIIGDVTAFLGYELKLSYRQYQEQIEEDINKWLSSPVQYIITKNEAKRFKKLENKEEKICFINYFWLR